MHLFSNIRSLSVAALVVAALFSVAPSHAQTGVSDDRVSLPDGPGSLDGIGDNTSVDQNMGQMTTSVKVKVPGGYAGLTPEISLGYSSGGGSGTIGIGWSMSMPFIERKTSKGLPEYDDEDRFVFGGGQELVRVDELSNASVAVYRARFEGGFTRYKWHNRGVGDEGYWTAENSDGTVVTFGADPDGTLDESTRVRSENGVFRYLATEVRDPWGHRMTYSYQVLGSKPLIDTISYVIDDNDNAGQRVRFTYAEREDKISDARGGFNEVTAHRLTRVEVLTGAAVIRRYELGYEPYENAGGQSRLSTVKHYGADGGLHPTQYSFTYSSALAGVCDGVDCAEPYVMDVGSLAGVNLEAGNATMVDLNGDGLPDFIETPNDGTEHKIHLSKLDAAGMHTFDPAYSSALTDTSSTLLSVPSVQLLDYDGDGFVDLVNALTGQIFVNRGSGDWDEIIELGATDSGTLAASDFELDEDAELTTLRFFDYDSDGKIDILKASNSGTSIVRNTGNGFLNVPTVADIGATFVDDNLELADMNGDGLLDPTIIAAGEVRYRINLGHGKWAQAANAWKTIENAPVTFDELEFASLEDLNGDGIDDLVVVIADTLKFALNRNGDRFDDIQTITTIGGEAIPYRDNDTTVLFADMNANGSNDVVWVTSQGNVKYLELFPVRPNLLTRYENGIGLITEVTYKSAVEERAKNPDAWPDPIPAPMLVVSTIDTYAAAGDPDLELHNLIEYTYEQGYYDGVEKAFRGFGEVKTTQEGDDYQEHTTHIQRFHLGQGGLPERAGQILYDTTLNAAGAPMLTVVTGYSSCDVAEFDQDATTPPIHWQCPTSVEETIQEGAAESEWLVTLSESEYDGFGNVVVQREFGVTSKGGGACGECISNDGTGEPCGAQCLGDERFTESTYISPTSNGDFWTLDLLAEESTFSSASTRRSATRRYYDGNDFVGFTLGEASLGFLTRISEQVDDDTWADIERNKSDEHGNIVEFIGANGDLASGGYRSFTDFSDNGLDLVHQETMVSDEGGDYRLQRDITYEPLFGEVASATRWNIVGGPAGLVVSWGYDEFGRTISAVKGDDTPAAPTEAYIYDLAKPVSRITTLKRSQVGEDFDLEEVSCIDGLGRTIQTRTKIAAGRYLVSGLKVFNHRGKVVKEYQAYEATTNECNLDTPPQTRLTLHYFDSLGREVRTVHPDAEEQGGVASEKRIVYEPLKEYIYNEDDNDDEAPGYDTPNLVVRDGLDRIVRSEKTETPTSTPIVYHIRYDDLFNIRGFIDPEGNEKIQTFDLRERVLHIADPDAGDIFFEYDDMGNITREENGAGRVVRREYDEQGRMVHEYDDADQAGTERIFYYDRHPTCPASICQNLATLVAGQSFHAGDLGLVEEFLSYNNHGNTIRTERSIGGKSLVFETRYDNVDRLIAEVFPGGFEIGYTLDGMGRFTSVPGFVDDIQHNANGMVESFSMANGLTQSYSFGERNQVSSMRVQSANDDVVIDHLYQTDRAGNLREIEDHVVLDGVPSRNAIFSIDGLNRLITTQLDAGTADAETISIDYDDMDRITAKTSSDEDSPGHVGSYDYDDAGPKAVTLAGDTSWTYDDGGFAATRGDHAFEWTAWGMVSSIEDVSGEVWNYFYNAGGERFYRQSDHGQELSFGSRVVIRDGIARISVGIDNDPFAFVEVDVATLVLHDEDDNGAIDAHDAFLARDTDQVAIDLRSAARSMLLGDDGTDTQYLLQDLQGNVLAVADTAGEITERLDYYSYGSIRYSSAGQTENARFAGVEYEPTGFMDFGKRFYSPQEGRWTAVDPGFTLLTGEGIQSLTAAVSSYGYAGNNPATLIDFGGTVDWKTVGKVALGVLAVGAAVAIALSPAGPIIVGAAVATLAAATVVNIVGAVIGSVTSAVHSGLTQRATLKADYTAQGKSIPKLEVFKAVGWGIVASATGAVNGFFTGGISAGFVIADGGVKIAEAKGVISNRTANIASAALNVSSAVVSIADPLSLATSTPDVGRRALESLVGLAAVGVAEGITQSERKRRNERSRKKRKKSKKPKKVVAKKNKRNKAGPK
ncbi:MAG: hypothetical protein GY822_25020 [Deltaproteobacteria bacterium]|nr:hypothetical protein [Deltaproteobacteria bacterium]